MITKITNKDNTNNIKASNNGSISKFNSDDSDWMSDMLAQVIKSFGMQPKDHDLSFDVLLNQHLVIIYLLFFRVVAIIMLTVVFVSTACIYYFKDYFLNNFKNYYINLYIRYQILLAIIFFVIYPILFLLAMFVLAHGLYYLVTHPIIINYS